MLTQRKSDSQRLCQ